MNSNLRFGLERYAAQLQSLCCHGDFADSYDWLATSSICHLQVFDPLLAKFAPALARARHLQAVDLYDDSNSGESVTENAALLEVWLRSDYAKAGLRKLRLEGGAFAEGFPSCLRGLQLRKLSFSEYFVDPKKVSTLPDWLASMPLMELDMCSLSMLRTLPLALGACLGLRFIDPSITSISLPFVGGIDL
ncbi:hypothetical protein T492DRAFT_931591, partial [Pavlovales sp. CCMP2436]